MRLCKIENKTVVPGGKVQLNLRYGANIIADNTYKSNDSIVISLKPEDRFKILEHYPFAAGNMATIIGGRHSRQGSPYHRDYQDPGQRPEQGHPRRREDQRAFRHDHALYLHGRKRNRFKGQLGA
jgi:SSU ribosomal protein S4E